MAALLGCQGLVHVMVVHCEERMKMSVRAHWITVGFPEGDNVVGSFNKIIFVITTLNDSSLRDGTLPARSFSVISEGMEQCF